MAGPLTPEQAREVEARIKVGARRNAYGRKFFPATYGPIGFGKQSITYDKLTEMSAGSIDFGWVPEAWPEDATLLTRTTLKVPVLYRKWTINARDLESSRTTGTPLDMQAIDAATYKVVLKENAYLIQGYAADGSNYDVNGLYQAAGNTASGGDFGTATNVPSTIAAGGAALMADNIYPPYNLGLHPTQYNELFNLFSSTGISSKEYLANIGIIDQIIPSPDLTAGTGLMVQATPGSFDLAIGVDYSHKEVADPLTGNMKGFVYVCEVPRFWDANAVCTLTSI